jgi:hypothetical protein
MVIVACAGNDRLPQGAFIVAPRIEKNWRCTAARMPLSSRDLFPGSTLTTASTGKLRAADFALDSESAMDPGDKRRDDN